MRLTDLSPEQRRQLEAIRFDRIVEKHEGPWELEWWLREDGAEFMTIDGFEVLLPVEKDHHANMEVVRCIVSEGRDFLTIFLTDTTFYEGMDSGFIAICKRFPGAEWYVGIVYHEWFTSAESP